MKPHHVFAMLIVAVPLSCGRDHPTELLRPSQIEVLSGTNQKGTVGDPLAHVLIVRVTSAARTPVARIPVTWTVVVGSGLVTPQQSTTDDNGFAQAVWALGTSAGEQRLRVAAADLSTEITATAVADRAVRIDIEPAEIQLLRRDRRQLTATAWDRYGNLAEGRSQTWRSDDTRVAEVDSAGWLTARNDGTASVHVAIEDAVDSVRVAVTSQIAFLAIVAASQTVIHIVNANGSGGQTLTPMGPLGGLRWSPRGDKLVYAMSTGQAPYPGVSQVFSMNPDGSDLKRLTSDSIPSGEPAWSADGSRIAFTRGRNIYVMNSDGSGITAVAISTPSSGVGIGGIIIDTTPTHYSPFFTPAGRVGYVSEAKDAASKQTRSEIRIQGRPPVTGYHWWLYSKRHLTTSPDGDSLLFVSNRDRVTGSTSGSNLWVIALDGTGERQLTNDGDVRGQATWGPDGRRIAFSQRVSDVDTDVFIMNADGSARVNLTPNTLATFQGSPTWRP